MRTKIIVAGLLASFLLMGATCSSTDVATIIQQVQDDTSTACKFVPTAATIAAIVAANNPSVTTATQIAEAICAAVSKKAAAAPSSPVGATVAGVVIRGYFIK